MDAAVLLIVLARMEVNVIMDIVTNVMLLLQTVVQTPAVQTLADNVILVQQVNLVTLLLELSILTHKRLSVLVV